MTNKCGCLTFYVASPRSGLDTLFRWLAEAGHQLLNSDIKSLTDPQKSEHRDWSTTFDHLPVPSTKTVRNHVLLAQLSVGSVGANTLP